MNPQEVLNQVPERAEIEQQLNTFVKEKQAEMQQKSTEFQEAVTAYQQEVSSLSQEQQQKREQELSAMEQELTEMRESIRQQINQRQNELMAPLYNRMDQAIAAIAEENNLDFVFNEATGYGETIIYYAADETIDITQQVLDRMNSESTATN